MYIWSQKVDKYLTASFSPEFFNTFKAMLLIRIHQKDFFFIIALDGDEIIAHATLIRSGGNFFPKIQHVAGFYLLVNPTFQGLGLGAAMINKIEQIAKEQDILKLEISVVIENVVALHLYEKLGYLKEGMHEKSVKLYDGRYVDKISFGKIL